MSLKFKPLLTEYYALNVVILSSYVLLRQEYRNSVIQFSYTTIHYDFGSWEKQLAAITLITIGWKYFKARCYEAFVSHTVLYLQMFLSIMALATNTTCFALYLVAFAALYLLYPQPIHTGPDKTERLNPLSLQETVLQSNSPAWVVTFGTSWSLPCRQLSTTLASIANRYTTEKLKFGRIDVSDWPHLAKKYNIDVSSVTQQLPTVILFENGEEKVRLPQLVNNALKFAHFAPKDIVKAFELDMRYTSSRANKQE